jgi:hypothetical protein
MVRRCIAGPSFRTVCSARRSERRAAGSDQRKQTSETKARRRWWWGFSNLSDRNLDIENWPERGRHSWNSEFYSNGGNVTRNSVRFPAGRSWRGTDVAPALRVGRAYEGSDGRGPRQAHGAADRRSGTWCLARSQSRFSTGAVKLCPTGCLTSSGYRRIFKSLPSEGWTSVQKACKPMVSNVFWLMVRMRGTRRRCRTLARNS